MSITRDEWMAEIERVMSPGPTDDGMKTINEIATAMGIARPQALQAVRALSAAGRIEVGRGKRLAIDGVLRLIAVYRIKPALAPKRARG